MDPTPLPQGAMGKSWRPVSTPGVRDPECGVTLPSRLPPSGPAPSSGQEADLRRRVLVLEMEVRSLRQEFEAVRTSVAPAGVNPARDPCRVASGGYRAALKVLKAAARMGLPGEVSPAALDFASSYYDYKASVGEEPDPAELEEIFVQINMLGCSLQELREFAKESRERLERAEAEWPQILQERFFGFCLQIMDKHVLLLRILKFEMQ